MNFIGNDYFMGVLLKQARKTGLDKLEINVLNNSAEPKKLLTKSMIKSIGNWNKWFPTLVEGSGSSMDFVMEAKMIIEFDLSITRPYLKNKKLLESPFNCTMFITDDRGKKYVYKHEGWWFPEN